MNDDFDTPVAIAALFELARAINRFRSQAGATRMSSIAPSTPCVRSRASSVST